VFEINAICGKEIVPFFDPESKTSLHHKDAGMFLGKK
jgi:hypothetical protein